MPVSEYGSLAKTMLSNKSKLNLLAMSLVENFSNSLNTVSWIWGGFTIDIYENRILREHDDLDYLTLNLHNRIPEFTKLFKTNGWQTKLLENGDLKLKQKDIKIQLGHIEFLDKVCWSHNGDKGSIWFPAEWLNMNPVKFCGIKVHVVQPEFQYVLLEHPQILNPEWNPREKDIVAREYLKGCIENKGICPGSLFEQVHDERKTNCSIQSKSVL